MSPVVPFVLSATLLFGGCKAHETVKTTVASNQTGTNNDATPGPPTQGPSEPVIVPENSDINATLSELSTDLRVYVSRTRSAPKDFQDFVTRAQLQAPPPPAGKSYAIASGKVVLVNQ